jgi:acyl carrier protein
MPMDIDATHTLVLDCIAGALKVPVDMLTVDTVLLDVGADSIALTKVVYQLEQLFGIRMPEDLSIPDEFTVGTFVEAVRDSVAAQPRVATNPASPRDEGS